MSDVAVRTGSSVEPDDLTGPDRYFNREISWLDFDDRVLQLAEDEATPLLERLKFCAIWSTNLDEFFMVRVAGLHDVVEAGGDTPGKGGPPPPPTLQRTRAGAAGQQQRVCRCLHQGILPALAEHGIRVVDLADVDEKDRAD